MKRYTFVTTYLVEASDETTATKTKEGLEAWLKVDARVAEHYTNLTDIEDFTAEEEHEQLGWDECTDEECDYHNDEHAETEPLDWHEEASSMPAQQSPTRPQGQDSVGFGKLMGFLAVALFALP